MCLNSFFNLALKTDGTLWAWGKNDNGECSNSTIHDVLYASQIGNEKWISIAAGESHSLAVKSNGTLWAWGRNNNGELGLGTPAPSGPDYRTSPVQVGTATNWLMVSAGYRYSVGLKTDGTLWTWGRNDSRQLGNGFTNSVYTPTQIGTANNWIFISAGYGHTVALRSNGTLWVWENNDAYQLGLGSTTTVSAPQKIGVDTD